MMKGLYVVFDCVADEPGPVFEAKNDGVALRMYKSLCENSGMKNCDEFELRFVGQFDTLQCVAMCAGDYRVVKANLSMEVGEDA